MGIKDFRVLLLEWNRSHAFKLGIALSMTATRSFIEGASYEMPLILLPLSRFVGRMQ